MPLRLLLACLPQDTADTLPRQTVVTAPRALPTATESSATYQVVTAEELRNTGEQSLPRAIARAAGLGVWNQETNSGGGSPILRGLIGPHVLILVDGVRLNDSTTRLGPNQSLNTIDVAIVERVEIRQGPGAVLYGSDAIGGVILIWTRRRAPDSSNARGELNGLGGEAGGAYQGANDAVRGSLELSGSSGSDGWLGVASFDDRGALRTADGELDFTAYDSNAVFGSWSHGFGPHRTLRASARVHRDFDVPRTDRLLTGYGQTQPSNAEYDFNLQENAGLTLAFTDDESGGFVDRFQARLFLRSYVEDRYIRNTGSTTRRMERDETLGFGLGLDWQRAIGDAHLLTFGFDAEHDDVDSERTDVNLTTAVETPRPGSFAPNSRYSSFGVFAQDEILALAPFDVTAGVRYSYFDFGFNEFTSTPAGGPEREGSFDALTASLAVARDLGHGLRAIASVAQGFRAPHLDDLARNSTVFGGTELANPELDPERSLTAEIALEYGDGVWAGSLSTWFTRIEDYLGRVLVSEGNPGTSGDETYLRENTGRVDLMGFEAQVQRRLGDEGADWALAGGLSLTHGRQYDDTINPLSGLAEFDDVPARRIPPLNGYLALLYGPKQPAGCLGWGEVRLFMADLQDELHPEDLSDPRINPEGTPGFATLDLDLGGPLGGRESSARWNAGVHNVLDKAYRMHGSGLDAPGINAVFGFSWSF